MLLINGDAIEEMNKLPEHSVDCVITDLPYGTTTLKWDTIIPFDAMWKALLRITKDNTPIILFGIQPFTSKLICSNLSMFKYEIIWKKTPSGFINANKMPIRNVENILIFYKKQPTYNPQGLIRIDKICKNTEIKKTYSKKNGISSHNGGRFKSDTYIQKYTNHPTQIIEFKKDKGNVHPTQKPIALMEYLVATYSNPGDTVLDFTMGSGTTGVACKNLSRNFIGIETNKDYYNLAVERINSK